ncbi:MAG: ECF-type sigma factor [Verrucomicrobia bacterium]|nr:ECF-type sigma factor [Verrucomicrobiota bacterium]
MSPSSQKDGSTPDSDFYELVYEELRQLAHAKMSKEYVYSTIQSTALVHEAWLKLGGDEQPQWSDRSHFFAAAAEAMRRILIDRARKRRRKRHGGDLNRVALENLDALHDRADADDQLIRINEALEKLALKDERKAELVKQRFFFGLSLEEAAQSLGVSPTTAQRWWTYARSWLYNEISNE